MKQKIAIIEDEAAIAEMYRFKLEQRGYEVQCALDGKRGLALVKDFPPDLILLDLMVPALTGVAMLEKVRAEVWGGDIRIVVLTNISKDEAPSSLRFLNVDRYIVKAHHTPAQVATIVDEILSKPAKAK